MVLIPTLVGTATNTGAQVMWHVSQKLQCPPAATPPYTPKWRLETAAAALQDVGLEPGQEVPRPQVRRGRGCGQGAGLQGCSMREHIISNGPCQPPLGAARHRGPPRNLKVLLGVAS